MPRRVSKTIINAIVKYFEYVRKYSETLRSKTYHYKYIYSADVPFSNKKITFVGFQNEIGAKLRMD